MSCRSSQMILATETYSDWETEGTPSEVSSRSPGSESYDEEDYEVTCEVVVKSTFIHVDDGCGLMRLYRRLRRSQTDFITSAVCEEVDEPGKCMEDRSKQEDSPSASNTSTETLEVAVKPNDQVECKTTVMLRNVPNDYTREMLLELLDSQGFAGRYNFAYLPCDFYRDANLGYAFVNLVDRVAVDDIWAAFDGFASWSLPTTKVCQVRWSSPHQGFEAHVERYRNSPVMHRCVPDEYKPVIFQLGVRQPFPPPTKMVKAPMMGCR
ncbi:ML4 [Symbiodinium microadriaticum]|nr:ML4 [Symbiodinium microadriaticum]